MFAIVKMTSSDKEIEKEGVDLNIEEQEYGTKGAAGAQPEYSDAESKAFDKSLILKLDLLIIPLLTMV